jgi:hypothetical protein
MIGSDGGHAGVIGDTGLPTPAGGAGKGCEEVFVAGVAGVGRVFPAAEDDDGASIDGACEVHEKADVADGRGGAGQNGGGFPDGGLPAQINDVAKWRILERAQLDEVETVVVLIYN